jgi:glucokinase
MNSAQATIAIDVGASKIAGALVSDSFEILHHETVPAREELYGDADPDLVLSKALIKSLLQVAKEKSLEVVKGGACFAEYVTPDQLLNSKDQIAWSVQPKRDFAELTGLSWTIESDVRAMALAEARASQIHDFLFITVSSGISHALVINGKPWAGATGEAIGFGINQIDNSQESPTLEQFSSGLGIARRYQKATNSDVTSAEIVFDQFEKDPIAREIIESAASVLGKSIASLVDFLDPAKIIIGGGLWLGSDRYRKLVLESYQKYATKRRKAPDVVNSLAGSNSAVIGAAIAAN